MNEKQYGENFLGKVIRIISDSELIVNVGMDYLTVGDKIIVYTVGDIIKDLDGTPLGIYEYDKETLTVVTTTENFSVCKTEKIMSKSPMITLTETLTPTFIEYKKMNIDKNQINEIVITNKDKIQVGDPIKIA